MTHRDILIMIPKGCACQGVTIGGYENQVVLPTPQFMQDIGSIGCLTFRDTTCIDRCVAPLVQALWERGVVTTGACCGHNIRDGYIGIYESGSEITDQETMQAIRIEALAALDELRAILAAPAVERQEPVGFRYRAHGGHWEWMDESPFADGREHYKLGGEELQPLYTSPPTPSVERQPVAYVLTRDDDVCYEADDGIVISNTPGDETSLYKWKPVYFELSPAANVPDEHSEFESRIGGKLMGNRHGERLVRDSYGTYRDPKVRTLWMGWQARANLTSPPAPVAVVLSLRNMVGMFHHKAVTPLELETIRNAQACLDKVKEMNQ